MLPGAAWFEYPRATLFSHSSTAARDHALCCRLSEGREGLDGTQELLRRGYSERDMAKLWAGTFLRVWRETQKAESWDRRSYDNRSIATVFALPE